MKTLIIVRHAKAEVLPAHKTDYERSLTDSGKKDAEHVGDILRQQTACPEVFISSTAKRAWSTAKRIAAAFKQKEASIVPEKKIYNAEPETLIKLVQSIDTKFKSAILFGHNPGVSQLAFFFSGNGTIELPTCGVVIVEFDVDDWQNVAYKNGKITYFNRP